MLKTILSLLCSTAVLLVSSVDPNATSAPSVEDPPTSSTPSSAPLTAPSSTPSSAPSTAPTFTTTSSPLDSNIELPLGDINVLVVTDIHSWVGGHKEHEPQYDADYGDVLSFYQRLQERCVDQDLWFVMNGDWVHGTGLTMNGDVSSLVPILEHMPWDAINVGNHELYQSSVIEYIARPGGIADWWNERYLTSNVIHPSDHNDHKPLGKHYRLLNGTHYTVLTFGFLYNMHNHDPSVTVEPVETTVESDWFIHVLQAGGYDAVLVLAHMDVRDSLVDVLLNKIREIAGPDMPIQFITGHTHIRDYAVLDDRSTSFEAGRYLDTVGFVSFPAAATTTGHKSRFRHKFLDANKNDLRDTLGLGPLEALETEDGKELSEFIHRTRRKAGLLEKVGCSDRAYFLNTSMYDPASLWRLFQREVAMERLANESLILFVEQGEWRYDLPMGELVADDIFKVSPFNDTVFVLGAGIPGDIILQLNETLNADVNPFLPLIPNFILVGDVVPEGRYKVSTAFFEIASVLEPLKTLYSGDLDGPFSTEISLTDLWFDFVSNHWSSCSGNGGHSIIPNLPWFSTSNENDIDDPTASEQALLVLAAFAVLFCGACLVWRERHGPSEPYERARIAVLTADDHELL